MNQFFYKKLDRAGKPELGKDGNIKEDCVNPIRVDSGHWVNDDIFVLVLNDGREESKEIEVPSLKGSKTKTTIKRERGWYTTQIPLDKEDAQRWREATEMFSGNDWTDLDNEEEEVIEMSPQRVEEIKNMANNARAKSSIEGSYVREMYPQTPGETVKTE